ncbi:tRNA (guanosine(46)-N7)-methyltransferase TrmB [Cytophagaceae bacterium 50C-KIRBA]|uniref:tRNA (guanine-N(7)-)-methyltransferase n=1 Tax=Aquirufa beregesia TaxID=2516556 RepID=A0ABX0EX91_9BACT|nr:tRNA (guanosine(46)-N7)-methyltransferase TrmB [Aquirufa beregesia]NGZ43349.1 tRNA (guanosine(46)-N7)-methyltransferase TrmB [Aquirufa beregesia]
MSRRKEFKYDLAIRSPWVIQSGKDFFDSCRGKWQEIYFKNTNPIVLELGCGRGEYSLGLAKLFPDKNFIGIDIKGDRLAAGARQAETEGLNNVVFLRIQIQHLPEFFAENEVDEIWITFPDPRPKDRDEKKRLTFPFFLNKYQTILKSQGIVHLKTDSDSLFEYSLEQLVKEPWQLLIQTWDLYQSEWNQDHYGIKTRFEELFFQKGFSIKYLRAINNK